MHSPAHTSLVSMLHKGTIQRLTVDNLNKQGQTPIGLPSLRATIYFQHEGGKFMCAGFGKSLDSACQEVLREYDEGLADPTKRINALTKKKKNIRQRSRA